MIRVLCEIWHQSGQNDSIQASFALSVYSFALVLSHHLHPLRVLDALPLQVYSLQFFATTVGNLEPNEEC